MGPQLLVPLVGFRLVRVAELALTTLHGAAQMATLAPGFVEPYDLVSACENLAALELNDVWPPPATQPTVQPADLPWNPPQAIDAMDGTPVDLAADGIFVFLGLHRLTAAEDVIRTAPGATIVLVTGDPDELVPLVRLALTGAGNYLRYTLPSGAWPDVRIVCDNAVAPFPVSDVTESAIRVAGGRIVARFGPGAGYALADNARHTEVGA